MKGNFHGEGIFFFISGVLKNYLFNGAGIIHSISIVKKYFDKIQV